MVSVVVYLCGGPGPVRDERLRPVRARPPPVLLAPVVDARGDVHGPDHGVVVVGTGVAEGMTVTITLLCIALSSK